MSYKINIYNILTYALFFATIKPYFIPEPLRQILKIAILIGVFLFVISNSEHKRIFNVSLIFCASVFISAIVSMLRGDYGLTNFLESLLYMLTFYDLYTFIGLCHYKGRFSEMMRCIYRITFLYCGLTVISVLMVGVVNNSNQAVYFFGNKFSSSYLFILFLALFGATHKMDEKRNIIFYYILFAFTFMFTLYIGCATTTVTIVILFAMNFLPNKAKKILLNEKLVVGTLIMSAVIIIWVEQILKIGFINDIIAGYFNKSYTVTGRLEIYNIYLMRAIMGSFWFGYGYSNSLMMNLTDMYANAQNGLLDIFLNLGIVGVVTILITIFYCYRKAEKNENSFYISLIVYGMIIAAVFEISLNWFFILGLCLIRWNDASRSSELYAKNNEIKG